MVIRYTAVHHLFFLSSFLPFFPFFPFFFHFFFPVLSLPFSNLSRHLLLCCLLFPGGKEGLVDGRGGRVETDWFFMLWCASRSSCHTHKLGDPSSSPRCDHASPVTQLECLPSIPYDICDYHECANWCAVSASQGHKMRSGRKGTSTEPQVYNVISPGIKKSPFVSSLTWDFDIAFPTLSYTVIIKCHSKYSPTHRHLIDLA